MAEDVAAPPVASRAERARASAYYGRFTIAYTLLAVVAAGAVGAFVVVLTRPDVVRAPPWSSFVPRGSSAAKVNEIAARVSAEYQLSTGGKLVSVVPSPLQATRFIQTDSGPVSVQVPISAVAVQGNAAKGNGDFTSFNAASTVTYQMCGFGSSQQNCAVAAAAASPTRGQLLRREALELALYTLKYVPELDAVLTYLPPPANAQASPTSVLVARKDVKQDLDRPLTRTLAPQKVVLDEGVPDAAAVDRLTLARLYTYDYQTLPGDGSAILVLTAAITAR